MDATATQHYNRTGHDKRKGYSNTKLSSQPLYSPLYSLCLHSRLLAVALQSGRVSAQPRSPPLALRKKAEYRLDRLEYRID